MINKIHKWQAILLSLILLFGFAFFSKYVKNGGLKNTDFATTIRLQNHIPDRFGEILDDGAILADPIVSSAIVIVITGVGLVSFRHRRIRWGILILPVAFLLLTMAETYGKNFLPHPGPAFFMVKHPKTIFPKFYIIEPYSYPSGHAARSTFIAFSLFFLWIFKKKLTVTKILVAAVIFSYVLFVYIGRVYLGQHWLSDIIGGIILGSGFGLLSFTLY